MFLRPVKLARPGDVLALTVRDGLGQPLLEEGVELTSVYIDALRRRGVATVYLRDGLADDVVPERPISEATRATVAGHLATTFTSVEVLAAQRGFGSGGVEGAIAQLGEQPLDLGPDGARLVEQLYTDVDLMLSELLETSTVGGLEPLRAHSEYTYQHSVDVAVVGVLLGSRLGLPRARLREMALGCLLHDIGKLYIDQAILDKPGKLTPEEFAAVQAHPRMGFELCRRMPVGSVLPAHVAYQHHERQDGGGYPRGLVGNNRIGNRLAQERIGAGEMLLIAEIAAVADVYSALRMDRPYRDAMLPDAAMDTMTSIRGAHLNREVLDHLHAVIPRFPTGTWVEVRSGRFAGWRGVVTDLHPDELHRPTLRLLVDATGAPTASPAELDTRAEPDLTLTCLPRDGMPSAPLVPRGEASGDPAVLACSNTLAADSLVGSGGDRISVPT